MYVPEFPKEFSERMQRVLKDEYESFFNAHTQAPPVSIRVNHKKALYNVNGLKQVLWAEEGFYLNKRPSFAIDPYWHGGAYYVQEASSMFLKNFLKNILNDYQKPVVLDLCAAPGGKSSHIASLLPDDGLLVSNEIIRQRAHILSENICKWGSGNVIVTCNEPKGFEYLPDFFDVMVIDAPCSGEGMFRKDPEAIQEWSLKNVKLCSERQKKIISDVWGSLKEDGVLIYSTCTYNQNENEQILEWVSENYEVEKVKIVVPESWNIEKVETNNMFTYRFYPQRLQGEGLFFSAFRKKESNSRKNVKTNQKSLLSRAQKSEIDLMPDWITNDELWFKGKIGEKLILFPEGHFKTAERVYQQLYVVHGGLEVANIIRTQANPLPDLALFSNINKNAFQVEEVDLQTALQFLKREDISIQESTSGWTLISFHQLPLGWVKKSGNKITNYYPKEWKLRMDWKEIERILLEK